MKKKLMETTAGGVKNGNEKYIYYRKRRKIILIKKLVVNNKNCPQKSDRRKRILKIAELNMWKNVRNRIHTFLQYTYELNHIQ